MILFTFLLASLALFFQTILVPRLAILAYAPWIACLSLSKRPLSRTLWLSALAGTILDLLSDDPMGLHALNYVLTAALLFRYRKHFSQEVPFHLSLFTVFVSILSTFLQIILLFLFDRRVPFDGRWILTDLVGMPVIDGLYAFVWFSAPLAVVAQLRKYWMIYWLKRKRLSPTSHS